jgi:hypothetical protein
MGFALVEKDTNYERLTPLNMEMRICANYLHIPHYKFKRLPFEEKMKWIYFEKMEREREIYFDKKQIEEMRKERDKHKHNRGKL